MDNASFHDISTRVKEMFAETGVLIENQLPYSPDLNPIDYFGSLKNIIRSRSLRDEDLTCGDFEPYLRMQIKRITGQGERERKRLEGISERRRSIIYNLRNDTNKTPRARAQELYVGRRSMARLLHSIKR
jgi:transposase